MCGARPKNKGEIALGSLARLTTTEIKWRWFTCGSSGSAQIFGETWCYRGVQLHRQKWKE
jgi:hypothetical protein